MAANQKRGKRITLERMMREHDALPRTAKAVSMFAWHNITAESAISLVGYGPQAPSEKLRRAFEVHDQIFGIETWRDYGPLHPEYPEHLKRKAPPEGAWWAKGMRHGRA